MKERNMRERNMRIQIAKKHEYGFNVYLDFSGQREYVITHRKNDMLYFLLKDGVVVSDLRNITMRELSGRLKMSITSRSVKKAANSLNHLMNVIDDYLTYRDAC